MSHEQKKKEFDRLCDAVFDGTATDQQVQLLEQMVLSSKVLKKEYVRKSQLHASLFLLSDQNIIANNGYVSRPDVLEKSISTSLFQRVTLVFISLAAMVIIGLLIFPQTSPSEIETFAKLVTNEGTRWESSTVPIENLARIGQGRLRLAEGIARIHFDNGAKIDLEGPADFELLNKERCRLHQGRLVVTVESELKGFVVETPSGILTDQGTKFGVNVISDDLSSLEVFDGQVDVEHLATGETEQVFQQEGIKLSDKEIIRYESKDLTEFALTNENHTRSLIQISTATGAGKDHWIQRSDKLRDGPEDMLLVKSQYNYKKERPHLGDYDRKSYLGFDLSNVKMDEINEASLQLTAVPSGLGFATFMPDATFAVYGLLDESLEDWDPENLIWENAPGNSEKAMELDPEATMLLGKFVVKQGQQRGQFSLSNETLLQFLKSDTNGAATLIVVCETYPLQGEALVLGFAGRNHATQPPPTLRLWLKD